MPSQPTSPKTLSTNRAILELCLAGVLWGFGFVAAIWSLEAAGPLAITGWRFAVATAIGSFFLFRASARAEFRRVFIAAAIPGLCISATLVLQTIGLQYTTATKSGFITTLYVLMVPAFERILGHAKPSPRLLLCGFMALIGVAMMCGIFEYSGLDAKSRLNWGDGLTFLCAIGATIHIIVVGRVSHKLKGPFDSFHFNTAQSVWAAVPAIALAFLFEPGIMELPQRLLQNHKAIAGFMSISIGSTLIAFALQVRAQKVLRPALASLLFLLESPFAALFGFLLLGEALRPVQIAGGVVILFAVGLATRPETSISKAEIPDGP